jgi:hypothetical protein
MDVTACIFLLSMINIVMHIALQGSIAARRVSVETTGVEGVTRAQRAAGRP